MLAGGFGIGLSKIFTGVWSGWVLLLRVSLSWIFRFLWVFGFLSIEVWRNFDLRDIKGKGKEWTVVCTFSCIHPCFALPSCCRIPNDSRRRGQWPFSNLISLNNILHPRGLHDLLPVNVRQSFRNTALQTTFPLHCPESAMPFIILP